MRRTAVSFALGALCTTLFVISAPAFAATKTVDVELTNEGLSLIHISEPTRPY